jgi:predicted Ser/Thr protein kinase
MANLEIGSTVGGYRIESVAGKGGMGVVYVATQLRLNRRVALKVIAPDLAEDPGFRERFTTESQIAASIDHPNVIPVYEAGEHDGLLYLSMRYVDGTDLGKLLRSETRLEARRGANILLQAAEALDAAHQRGLVHRDVKPGNILIAAGDRTYLTDFGLTKHAESASGLTKTGTWVGTVDYVAPEQIQGEHVDARSDVYALGCVLFHTLSGQIPFPRPSEIAKIYAHLSDDPPAIDWAALGVPEGIDAVVRRAMAKDPAAALVAHAADRRRGARAARGRRRGHRRGHGRVQEWRHEHGDHPGDERLHADHPHRADDAHHPDDPADTGLEDRRARAPARLRGRVLVRGPRGARQPLQRELPPPRATQARHEPRRGDRRVQAPVRAARQPDLHAVEHPDPDRSERRDCRRQVPDHQRQRRPAGDRLDRVQHRVDRGRAAHRCARHSQRQLAPRSRRRL